MGAERDAAQGKRAGAGDSPARREPWFAARPSEEDERRALIWLTDVRAHGGPLDRRYAATIIETLAWFEAENSQESPS